MNRPTRQTTAGRAYLDLQNRARREKRTTQELLTLYVLERWLARLATSPYAGSFVLKGGLLLAVFDARRPTADADLLARDLAHDQASIAGRVRDIAKVPLADDDGVDYFVDTITVQTIRDDADYPVPHQYACSDTRSRRSLPKRPAPRSRSAPPTPECVTTPTCISSPASTRCNSPRCTPRCGPPHAIVV